MTFPLLNAKDFPVLPPGYTFEITFHSVDPTFNERIFSVKILHIDEGKVLTEDSWVSEQLLLPATKELAKRAHLLLTVDKTRSEIKKLNKKLRERATK